jgi:hypothetical protein
VERLMHKKCIERLEERHITVPAAYEARRWRTAELMGGMWKVLAADQDAISFGQSHSKIIRVTLFE